TEEQLKDELERWLPLSVLRSGQSTDPVEVELDDDDLAHVLYTSGTESRPKGVMLSHKSILSEYVSCRIDGKMEVEDVAIHALLFFDSAQLHVFLGPSIYVRASEIILHGTDPEVILQNIEQERATPFFCPPTVWIAILRHPDFDTYDLSTLEK